LTVFALNKNNLLSLSGLHIEELLVLCKQKSQRAEFEIYQRYCKAMFNVAFRIVKDEHYAEDVMQEGFLKAFTKLDDYRQEVAFGAWLKRIVINQSIDFCKKNSALQFEELDRIIYKVEEENTIQSEIEFQNLKVVQVLDTIQNLKDNYRMVLTLFLIEGYDQEEICEILNISSANCRTTLSRAKESLRKALNDIIKK
jgi:RNA polymerase sigma-70 factor (ECF subfamily)